ncbi:haloacid dehalogenase type II [Streptomyces sp. NPDC047990]|uniref:haloacid dehalogenase type II n=1 Tax=Streptomyces sp. NPDC047990 TaxID=3365496 RepID=UPI0037204396
MNQSNGRQKSPRRFTTLFFDVFGTVVDLRGTVTDAARAHLRDSGLDQERAQLLAEEWFALLNMSLTEVRTGKRPWSGHDELTRRSLVQALERIGGQGAGHVNSTVEKLTLAVRRARAWPDSRSAIADLSEAYRVVALSNASAATLTELSAASGIRWHCVLSSEFARSYKPDPCVYAFAVETLRLDASEALMVAAHTWDLEAAARNGLATALVGRKGEDPVDAPGAFDFRARDLTDLADQLTVA